MLLLSLKRRDLKGMRDAAIVCIIGILSSWGGAIDGNEMGQGCQANRVNSLLKLKQGYLDSCHVVTGSFNGEMMGTLRVIWILFW